MHEKGTLTHLARKYSRLELDYNFIRTYTTSTRQFSVSVREGIKLSDDSACYLGKGSGMHGKPFLPYQFMMHDIICLSIP